MDKEVVFIYFDEPSERGGMFTQFIINVVHLDCRCEVFGSTTPDKLVPSYSLLRFDGNPFGRCWLDHLRFACKSWGIVNYIGNMAILSLGELR